MNVNSTEYKSDCDTDYIGYSSNGSYVTTTIVPNITINSSSGVSSTDAYHDNNLYSATISGFLPSSEYERDKYELQNEISELKKKLDTAMGLISELLNFKSQVEKGIEPTKLEGDDRVFESLF